MKRILEILTYCIDVLKAVTQGAKVCFDAWPAINPFDRTGTDVSIPKQQGQSDQPASDMAKSVQEPIQVPDGASQT